MDWSLAMFKLNNDLVPENCRFAVENIEDKWHHYDHKFDYIHARYIVTFVEDIPKLLRVI